MKKKNLKKLSLNKRAVSNLEKVNGGLENPDPVETGASDAKECHSKEVAYCATINCTVFPQCTISYFIC